MIRLFGLLHLEAGEASAVNVSVRSFRDQVEVYIQNALCLAASLRQRGIRFTLLTNQPLLIKEWLPADTENFDVQEIPFTSRVPRRVRFYSAHFKFDVFRYFADLDEAYVGLCDLDMVCNGDEPRCLQNLSAAGVPIFYDITDQVSPAYGHEVIIRDLQALHGMRSEGRWAGGEFIAGPPAFFKKLCATIDELFDAYLESLPTAHHVGDEALTSAALEVLRRRGVNVVDAGTLGIVGRYWSERPLHVQRPFAAYAGVFLLHLPSDKRFLAALAAAGPGSADQFLRRYSAYLTRSPEAMLRWGKRWFKRLAPALAIALGARRPR